LLLYYITDRHRFTGAEPAKKAKLLAKIGEAASSGVDFIQLRERDLSARDLEGLATEALLAIRKAAPAGSSTKLLINSRLDVALAIEADGVHLRSDDTSASEARAVVGKALNHDKKLKTTKFLISVSCHTAAEVRLAEANGADLVLFAPVFEKVNGNSMVHGIKGLRAVCRDRRAARPPVPILALGGVEIANAAACVAAGGVGIAGIRLFQEGDLTRTIVQLRALNRSS
jgi:thiamine-phosphate pyrophosphorylase